MPVISNPLYNDVKQSWAELEATIEHDGGSFTTADWQSVEYDHGLEGGDVGGTGPAAISRTQGIYKCSAKVKMLRSSANRLRAQLAAINPAYGLVSFNLVVRWDLGTGESAIDHVELRGCRLKKSALSTAAGSSDAIMEDVELHPLRIFENGLCPIGGT